LDRHLHGFVHTTGRHIGAAAKYSFHSLAEAGRFRYGDRDAFL
jgi:hypothetical protein